MPEAVDASEIKINSPVISSKESALARTEGRPILVLNPGHGNEPYIMATAIGREVSKKFESAGLEKPILVMPLLYGDRQKRIILEENPNDASMIYFDEKFGDILKDIMFGSGDFGQHVAQVNAHYDEVDKMLNNRFNINSESFTARSAVTQESAELSPKNIVGVIETGNKVSVKVPHRYYAFPEVLSRVLNESIKHPELGFSEADMKKLANRMIKVEAAYSQVFIPWVSTFSYQNAEDLSTQPTTVEGVSRTYTPAMKSDIAVTNGEVEPGVYIMFSGTGSASEANKSLISAAHQAGIKAFAPPWENIEGAEKAPPSVMSDRNIQAIMGRSGWGTGWQAMQLEKPWLVTPYQRGDDPEIYFNNKTIEALKLGRLVGSEGISADELISAAQEISPGLASLNIAIRQRFGTTDGIDYIADNIFKDLVKSK
ncbi:MAG TPA: hypothetical protein VHE53_03660 [Patescibacteria group bacterium]|nr:hypothetical protein [Patescibacteria group bacterium]